MAEPGDEFERILRDAQAKLDGIRLQLPGLDEGKAAPSSEWMAPSLDLPPPPAPEPPPPSILLTPLPKEEAPRRQPAAAARVEKPAPPARLLPPEEEAPRPATGGRSPWGRIAALGAAAAVLVAAGVWWLARPAPRKASLPLPRFDAIACRAGEWIVAQGGRLTLFDASSRPSALAQAPEPLASVFWNDGILYASGAQNTLYRWDSLVEPPKTFPLDHAPIALFVRAPHVWTLDRHGGLRQFLLSQSMTGVFLQPLDRVETGKVGDFRLSDDGTLTLLERASGDLLTMTRRGSAYVLSSRGASYGAGARLASADGAVWVAYADGEKTSLVPVAR